MYTVYAIKSKVDGRIYVGFTKEINRRIKEHNTGKTRSTRAFKPWVLIYKEDCQSRIEAREREKYLKGGSGKEFLKRIRDL